VVDIQGCFNSYTVDVGVINVDNTVAVNEFTLTATADADTYQWINADTEMIIPGATNKVYVAPGPGNYRVEMTIATLANKNQYSKKTNNDNIITFSSFVYEVAQT